MRLKKPSSRSGKNIVVCEKLLLNKFKLNDNVSFRRLKGINSFDIALSRK